MLIMLDALHVQMQAGMGLILHVGTQKQAHIVFDAKSHSGGKMQADIKRGSCAKAGPHCKDAHAPADPPE